MCFHPRQVFRRFLTNMVQTSLSEKMSKHYKANSVEPSLLLRICIKAFTSYANMFRVELSMFFVCLVKVALRTAQILRHILPQAYHNQQAAICLHSKAPPLEITIGIAFSSRYIWTVNVKINNAKAKGRVCMDYVSRRFMHQLPHYPEPIPCNASGDSHFWICSHTKNFLSVLHELLNDTLRDTAPSHNIFHLCLTQFFLHSSLWPTFVGHVPTEQAWTAHSTNSRTAIKCCHFICMKKHTQILTFRFSPISRAIAPCYWCLEEGETSCEPWGTWSNALFQLPKSSLDMRVKRKAKVRTSAKNLSRTVAWNSPVAGQLFSWRQCEHAKTITSI